MVDDKKNLQQPENQQQEIIQEQTEEQLPIEQQEIKPESEQVVTEQAPQEPSVPEKISSKHFKRVLEEKERAQRERDELLRLIQEDRNRSNPKSEQTQPEEDYGIDVNNFAEGKDLKKVFQEVSKLKQELQNYKKKTEIEVTEARLKSEFPDYDKVFTKENIKMLEAENPELVETIATSSADPYKVAKTMYKTLKQFGIHVDDTYEADRERVQKNIAKPKPVVSASNRQTSTSPLTKLPDYVDDLSEETKAALRDEVRRYKR